MTQREPVPCLFSTNSKTSTDTEIAAMTDPTQQLSAGMRAFETTGRIAARPLRHPGVADLEDALAQLSESELAALRAAAALRSNTPLGTTQEDIRP